MVDSTKTELVDAKVTDSSEAERTADDSCVDKSVTLDKSLFSEVRGEKVGDSVDTVDLDQVFVTIATVTSYHGNRQWRRNSLHGPCGRGWGAEGLGCRLDWPSDWIDSGDQPVPLIFN